MTADRLPVQLNNNTPEGWCVTTTAAHHLSLYHSDSGRTIALNEHQGQWTAMGLCQYGAEGHPRFALEANKDTAIEAAIDAMEAVSAGDPEAVDIVARASDLESPSKDGPEADIPSTTVGDSDGSHVSDNTDLDGDTDKSDDNGQVSLSDF